VLGGKKKEELNIKKKKKRPLSSKGQIT